MAVRFGPAGFWKESEGQPPGATKCAGGAGSVVGQVPYEPERTADDVETDSSVYLRPVLVAGGVRCA